MKLTGTFYVFAAGASWLCTCDDADMIKVFTYLLTFSEYDSGRVIVNAGVINALSQDLGLGEERVREAMKNLTGELLYHEYGVFRQEDREDRYVLIEGSYLVDPKYFWRGSAAGRKAFAGWFPSSINYRRALELCGHEETQWLIEPLDADYKQSLEDKYQKKKWLEERRRQAAEKRKQTIAAKKAAKLAEQAV